MSARQLFVAAAFVGAMALLGATASAQSVISFTSAAVGNTGVTGSGTIAPSTTGDESSLNVQWQGLVAGSVHMVTQYHGTSCGNYDLAPEFVFNTVTADSQGKAAAVITVKKPFRNWPNRVHFVVLHATAEASSTAIACGLVVAQAAPTAATAVPVAQASPAAPSTGNTSPSAGGPGAGILASVATLMVIASGAFGVRRLLNHG